MPSIHEKDWKIIRSMKKDALDLACRRIMEKISILVSADEKSAYTRYLELWEMIKAEDKNIESMFDNLKRSNALQHLSLWRFNDLITDTDLESFSPDVLTKISAYLEVWRQ